MVMDIVIELFLGVLSVTQLGGACDNGPGVSRGVDGKLSLDLNSRSITESQTKEFTTRMNSRASHGTHEQNS